MNVYVQAALKLAHETVVDTAFLFSLENNPRGSPGLKDVAAALLQVQMPEVRTCSAWLGIDTIRLP